MVKFRKGGYPVSSRAPVTRTADRDLAVFGDGVSFKHSPLPQAEKEVTGDDVAQVVGLSWKRLQTVVPVSKRPTPVRRKSGSSKATWHLSQWLPILKETWPKRFADWERLKCPSGKDAKK